MAKKYLHEEAVRAIERKIGSILELSNKSSSGNEFRRIITLDGKEGRIELRDEAADSYMALVGEVLGKHDWNDKFSEKHIAKELGAVVADGTLSPRNMSSMLRNLFNDFDDYDKTNIIHIPVYGIDVNESIGIGKVNFVKITPGVANGILSKCHDILDVSPNPESAIASSKKRLAEDVGEIVGGVCSIVKVEAEPFKAREYAIEETRRAIDIIRYALPLMFNENKTKVGIKGDPSMSNRMVLSISEGDRYVTMHESVGGYIPLVLSRRTVGMFNAFGFGKLSEWAGQDLAQDSIEQTILTSVHWFGNGVHQTRNNDALMSMSISLEALLTPKGSKSVVRDLKEGVAFIRGRDYEERNMLCKKVARLYGLRSGIAHGGDPVVRDSDVNEMTTIVINTLSKVIKMASGKKYNINTKDDLMDWIDKKRMS